MDAKSNPEPAGRVTLPLMIGPVPKLAGPTFDTVLSSVLTSAIQYFHPCTVVAVIWPSPAFAGGIEPSLIQFKFGRSAVIEYKAEFHVGWTVPDTPLS